MTNEEKVNILLVDDTPANLLSLKAILSDSGQNLVCANSGEEALKHLLEQDVAVILLDVNMPGIDGFELAGLIRSRPRSAHTPIIFLTAFATTEIDRAKGYFLGAVDYLFAPIVPEILKAKVSVFIDLFNMRKESERHVKELSELGQRLEKHLSEAERLNQELIAANKDLEIFDYTVSHDLRNPLTVIQLCQQILLNKYADKLDEDSKDYLYRIETATHKIIDLVEALLALSRMKRQEMSRQTVDLSALIETIAREFKETDTNRQVEFVIEKGVMVNGDMRFLRIAMDNLLGNAWKFTGKQSQAKIEFGTEEEGEKKEGNQTVYFIRDNGAGFNMEQADKLFTAFNRLHSANEFPGTGIGLATVQRIIHRHNGKIWAEAKPGEGACFYWTLGVDRLKAEG